MNLLLNPYYDVKDISQPFFGRAFPDYWYYTNGRAGPLKAGLADPKLFAYLFVIVITQRYPGW